MNNLLDMLEEIFFMQNHKRNKPLKFLKALFQNLLNVSAVLLKLFEAFLPSVAVTFFGEEFEHVPVRLAEPLIAPGQIC